MIDNTSSIYNRKTINQQIEKKKHKLRTQQFTCLMSCLDFIVYSNESKLRNFELIGRKKISR